MADHKLDTGKLWTRFSGHLRGFLRSRVSTDGEAEDLLQEIFLRIHEGLDSLKNAERVESWVFGIARRALADHYRSRSRSRTGGQRADDPDEAFEGDRQPDLQNIEPFEGEHDVHEEVLSWLIPMIDELPDKYRVPLRMADLEGMKQQEIADRLGLSLSGAKSRVQRAREKLGEILSECCRVEFGEQSRAVAFYRRDREECESCD